jgi:hypothetical protein
VADEPKKKRGNPENLARGLTPNQERGPDGKIRRKPPADQPAEPTPVQVALSSRTDGELAAMRWIVTHPPEQDETYEQQGMREFRASTPAAFWARKAKLEEAEGAKPSPPGLPGGEAEWDGQGPCPTCGHDTEKPLDDPQTDKIIAMLDELGGRAG